MFYTVATTLQNPSGRFSHFPFLYLFIIFLFSPGHNLGDCQSIMKFTVVDCVSPASLDAAAAEYDNKFISNILSVAHKYRDKRRRLCGTKHYPYGRGDVQSAAFYFLIIGRKIYSSVPRVRCIGLCAHQHTPTFINRKGFNLTTCH